MIGQAGGDISQEKAMELGDIMDNSFMFRPRIFQMDYSKIWCVTRVIRLDWVRKPVVRKSIGLDDVIIKTLNVQFLVQIKHT